MNTDKIIAEIDNHPAILELDTSAGKIKYIRVLDLKDIIRKYAAQPDALVEENKQINGNEIIADIMDELRVWAKDGGCVDINDVKASLENHIPQALSAKQPMSETMPQSEINDNHNSQSPTNTVEAIGTVDEELINLMCEAAWGDSRKVKYDVQTSIMQDALDSIRPYLATAKPSQAYTRTKLDCMVANKLMDAGCEKMDALNYGSIAITAIIASGVLQVKE